jgi:hypothetical protein
MITQQSNTIEHPKKEKKQSQVIGCRVPYSMYEAYEKKCIEEQITMSNLIKEGVVSFLYKK